MSKLRRWKSKAPSRAANHGNLIRNFFLMDCDRALAILTTVGYCPTGSAPTAEGGFTLRATHGENTYVANTVRMTLGDIGLWLL